LRKVTITRTETDESGTFGKLATDSGFECYTGELPQKNNLPDVSCIPAGNYGCAMRLSTKHGMCYGVENVPNRTDVEIHAGNFCGDVSAGLKTDVLGCIILGRAIGEIGNQKAILSSRDALQAFQNDLAGEAFALTIGFA